MFRLALLPILIVYGAWRFVEAARTGVLAGPRLSARREDQPVTFAINMTVLGGAVVGAMWLFATSITAVHVTVSHR